MAKQAPFVSIALANIPPRKAPHGRPFNTEAAKMLFDQVTTKIGQSGSSDGKAWDDKKEATKACGAARRMLVRYFSLNKDAEPENVKIVTRVWGSGDNQDAAPFRWSIHLATVAPKEKATE